MLDGWNFAKGRFDMSGTFKKSTRNCDGFSLVELAIALTVIGLLLAGLVKGQELIDNARTNRVVIDLNNIQTAMSNFKRMYNALPGDILNAPDRIPDCANAPCNGDGNGDYRIHTGSAANSNPFLDQNYPAQSEMRAFYVQLAKTGFIDGIDVGYTGQVNRGGVDFIETPYGGGYRVLNTVAWAGTGNVFPPVRDNVIRPTLDLHSVASSSTRMMFTARQAGQIDRKIDDGDPTAGRVYGMGTSEWCGSGPAVITGPGGGGSLSLGTIKYPENVRGARCNIIYVLGH